MISFRTLLTLSVKTSFAESAVSNIGIALMMNVERPHCRPFTVLTFQYIFNGMDEWSSSTKIEAVVEELSKLCHEDKTANRYEAGLLSSPIHFGDVALHFLMTKPTFAVVFLISFKVGGVALNLAKAI